jgi:hypothetical protein
VKDREKDGKLNSQVVDYKIIKNSRLDVLNGNPAGE